MYIRTVIIALCVSIAIAKNPLSFEDAFQRRLEIDKHLSALNSHRSGAELNVELSTALTPTELETVIGDFGRDEIEIAATQIIESPSIRKNRRLVAETELDGLKVEAANLHFQIHHDLSTYFLAAASLEEKLNLAHKRLLMSQNMLEWQERQFKEGALPESELIRTRYEIAGLNTELGRLELSQELLQLELAVYLDKSPESIELAVTIPEFPEPDDISNTWNQYGTAPAITRQEARVSLLKAVRQASETPFISSIAFSAGMKLLPEPGDQFPIIGFSLETPLFSKRSKTIQQSEFGLRAGKDELEAIKTDVSVAARHWMSSWNMNLYELASLQEIMIPEAQKLYERIDEEYRAGARQYLEVLGTQTLLTDLQQKELEIQTSMATLLFKMNLTLGVTIYEFD